MEKRRGDEHLYHPLCEICQKEFKDTHELSIHIDQVHRAKLLLNYFTTITGQCAYVTTSDATLPSNILVIPDLPLVPIIIKSTFSRSA